MRTGLVLKGTDVPDGIPDMMQIAEMLQRSKMLPDHLKGDKATIFNVMLIARSLDIPMTTAFQHVLEQDGKIGMSAVLMQALVLRAGHNLYKVSATNEQATVRAHRPGIGEDGEDFADITFTVQDAKRAGLLNLTDKGEVRARARNDADRILPWEAYTADMLLWRAIGRGARHYFSDVLMGVGGMVYTPDEIGGEVDEEGLPVRTDATVNTDIPEEVKAFILRINNARTLKALSALYEEIKKDGQLSAVTMDGFTLSQAVQRRKAALAGGKKTRGRGAAAAPVASDTSTESAGFDALPASDDVDTADTPRRKGVLKLASKLFGDPNTFTDKATEVFGRPPEQVGTADLQAWVLHEQEQRVGTK